jgi:hypothetical protein
MSTLEQIVAAAKKLKPADFIQLRKQLDRMEQRLWAAELSATARELEDAGVTDTKIDQMVMRRRREGRS